MPSRKTPDGEFKDIAHPINSETREKLQEAILSEFEKVMQDSVEESMDFVEPSSPHDLDTNPVGSPAF